MKMKFKHGCHVLYEKSLIMIFCRGTYFCYYCDKAKVWKQSSMVRRNTDFTGQFSAVDNYAKLLYSSHALPSSCSHQTSFTTFTQDDGVVVHSVYRCCICKDEWYNLYAVAGHYVWILPVALVVYGPLSRILCTPDYTDAYSCDLGIQLH